MKIEMLITADMAPVLRGIAEIQRKVAEVTGIHEAMLRRAGPVNYQVMLLPRETGE